MTRDDIGDRLINNFHEGKKNFVELTFLLTLNTIYFEANNCILRPHA